MLEAIQNALDYVINNADLIDEAEEQRLRRKSKQALVDLLNTRGYFLNEVEISGRRGNAEVSGEPNKPSWFVDIKPGPQSVVGEVRIEFKGDITQYSNHPERTDRLEQLYAQWELWTGQAFNQSDWELAKRNLLQRVTTREFPRANILESSAEVDNITHTVNLAILVDSGPAFMLGELEIIGLDKYNEELVARYNKLKPGQPYDQELLLETQSALQNTPYFAGVQVEFDTNIPENYVSPIVRPITLKLSEAKSKRLGIGMGASSNTGAHIEMSYRQSPFWSDANVLQSGMRVDRLRTLLYADVLLPPNEDNYRDSFGALFEKTNIQGLRTQRTAVGVTRAQLRDTIETRLALNVQRESREVAGVLEESAGVVTGTYTWAQRIVDNVTDPRRGYTWAAQLGLGSAFNLTNRPFTRAYLRGQYYYPINPETKQDVISLRLEAGSVNAPVRSIIPTDFLFRAGGTQSVRGYAFQSLGINTNSAILGGTKLVTASAEWTHWLDPKQGTALFYDVGDVADSFREMQIAHAVGIGYRYKTVAGPLAFDIAYGSRRRALKFHFSIAIAF